MLLDILSLVLILKNHMSILNPICIIYSQAIELTPHSNKDSLQGLEFIVTKVNDNKNHISATVSPKCK